jgi:transcriptional regulator with PAS, ATPase and Fis domain
LPPLRERPEDIELLADYFFKKYCSQHGRPLLGIEDEMMRVLKAYPFCGNVRELEGIINTAVLLEDGSSLSAHNLPAHLTDSAPDIFEGGDEDVGYNLDKLRCSTIARALKATKNNQSKAAELLGISRSTLHRFLNEQ